MEKFFNHLVTLDKIEITVEYRFSWQKIKITVEWIRTGTFGAKSNRSTFQLCHNHSPNYPFNVAKT